jgi:CubicO group peptidase (beta-lactamase class C family)
MSDILKPARLVLENALRSGVFPAATVDVGSSVEPLWQDALETTFDTPFDLASLTKPIATTTVVMNLVSNGVMTLDEPVARSMSEWRGDDRSGVTVRDLLEHASGLAARLVDVPPGSRREFEHEISTMQLEYMPRTQSIYSDLGFILLGFLAADRGQSALDTQFAQLVEPIAPALVFALSADERRRAAPTTALDKDIRRGRVLTGEVHDNYAASLGGVAGHAGLFGPAAAVGAFARAVLRAARGDPALLRFGATGASAGGPLTPAMVRLFTTPSSVPGSSRALGWDTMRPTSSCGTHMSSAAFGHVGFTGTSLWIDPGRDRYFVLLTNRAFTGASLDVMRDVRRAFHDALADL